MNINLTLLGEMITFALLVWVTMKYIWPPIVKAMHDREKRIADGLEAAERGQKSLQLAQNRIAEQLRKAKLKSNEIIEQANQRVSQMIEEAKEVSTKEGKKILSLAQDDINRELEAARQELRQEVAHLVIQATQKILQQKVDQVINSNIIDKIIEEF